MVQPRRHFVATLWAPREPRVLRGNACVFRAQEYEEARESELLQPTQSSDEQWDVSVLIVLTSYRNFAEAATTDGLLEVFCFFAVVCWIFADLYDVSVVCGLTKDSYRERYNTGSYFTRPVTKKCHFFSFGAVVLQSSAILDMILSDTCWKANASRANLCLTAWYICALTLADNIHFM